METTYSSVKPSTLDAAHEATCTIANQDLLEEFIRLDNNECLVGDSVIHLHCCRAGPILANEIFISINEKKKHPQLKKIYRVIQPGGTLSKYLIYWYGGLDKKYIFDFFRNIKFEGKEIFSQKSRLLSLDILFSSPDSLMVRWSHGVEIMFQPLIEHEAKIFLDTLEITPPELLDRLLSQYPKDKIFPMGQFLEKASLFLVNLLLLKKGFPEICTVTDVVTKSHSIEMKYIDDSLGKKRLTKIRAKNEKTISHAVDELRKKLRGFVSCNEEQFNRLFKTLSQKKNRAVAKGLLTFTNAKKICLENTQEKEILFMDRMLQDVIDSNTLLPQLVSNQGGIAYMMGSDMVEVCFELAHQYKAPLVLQKFFRIGGYEKYKIMMNTYPQVKTDKSSVDIWNTDIFPEYDMNFLKGTRYLNEV